MLEDPIMGKTASRVLREVPLVPGARSFNLLSLLKFMITVPVT